MKQKILNENINDAQKSVVCGIMLCVISHIQLFSTP